MEGFVAVFLPSGSIPAAGAGTSYNYAYGHYAAGFYVDPTYDGNSNIFPLQVGNSSRWWIWKANTLFAYGTYDLLGNPLNIDMAHAKQKMLLRTKYQRRFDATTDTLIFAIQNSANSTAAIAYTAMFRILVVER